MSTPITADRVWQIRDNVKEEFADHGRTSFATKEELCQVIAFLNNFHLYRDMEMCAIMRRLLTSSMEASARSRTEMGDLDKSAEAYALHINEKNRS